MRTETSEMMFQRIFVEFR